MELVINFSGGKDSCAMLAWLCEHYPDVQKHVVFADTGWEHEGAEQWCRDIVARFGLPLHVVRNPNKTFLSMVLNRGKFPGAQTRQCTSDLKRGPIQTWIRRNTGRLIVSCMGLRSAESPGRKAKRKLTRNKSMTNGRRTVWDWLPIKDWSDDQVFSYLELKGIPLHPVYSYLNRFSCQICIYTPDEDLPAIQRNNPKAIEVIHEIEQAINFSINPKGFIKDLLKKNEQNINLRSVPKSDSRRKNQARCRA